MRLAGSTLARVNLNEYDVRALSQQAEAGELANHVRTRPVARFLRETLAYRNEERRSNLMYSVTSTSVQAFKNEAINHLYRVLLEFIIVYTSYRVNIHTKPKIIIVQGSFFPDFIRTMDVNYDDRVAQGFCPANSSTAKRPSMRPDTGLLKRPPPETSIRKHFERSSSRSRTRRGTAAAPNNESCLLVSQNRHNLSKNFFRVLSYYLREFMNFNSQIDPEYRFSMQFAIEVNQAFSYLLFRGVDLASEIAELRSRRTHSRVVRIRDSDVVYAYRLLQPSPVNTATAGVRPPLTQRR
jgi:hypothetical protein